MTLMSEQPARKNIFLTDENVEGPAIEIARARAVEIIRDVDTDIPCDIDHYDQCLFDYAAANGYVLVTANRKDFDLKFFEYAKTHNSHPGLVLIHKNHRRSHYLIAEWLVLLSDEDMTNRIESI
jgi:hypothetical protein